MELGRIAIVGAGASSSTPKLGCVAGATPLKRDDGGIDVDYSTIKCTGCRDAALNPNGRNNRLNPSLLIQLKCSSGDAGLFNILIDCGKTFRESAIKVFPKYGVSNLNALLLTHNHADACFGMDDLREFSCQGDHFRSLGASADMPLFVFADPCTMDSMRDVFGYLFPKKVPHNTKGAWVAKLDWRTFEQGTVIDIPTESNRDGDVISSFPVLSFPVEHGPSCQCNAFLLELPSTNDDEIVPFFFYMSDVSKFELDSDGVRLMSSMETLHNHSRQDDNTDTDKKKKRFVIDILVLDLLGMEPYFAHFNRDEAVAAALSIGARQTYFVGMSHTMEYERLQRHVSKMALGHPSPTPSDKGLGSCYVTGTKPELLVGYDGCCIRDETTATSTKV